MRLLICLLLVALLLSACRQPYGEMYAWGDDWYMKNPSQAETFFDGLKTKLASKGFVVSGQPNSWLAKDSGMQPTEGDQVYWFQGSYQNSPMFQIKLLRDGRHLECFHLMYVWELVTYSSPNKEMEATTHQLHESLKDWVGKGGVANLPPRSE